MKLRQANKILRRNAESPYRGSTLSRANARLRNDWLYGLAPLTGVSEAWAEMARTAHQAAMSLWQLHAMPLRLLSLGRTNYLRTSS